MFRVARMLAIGAIALVAASGLAFGLFLPAVARADDPPPTTVPTPTLPTPDPAPPPKPKPKPAPKSAPRPAPQPRQVSPTPSYRPPATSSTRPAVKPKARVNPKPKKVPQKKAPVKKKTTVLPKVTVAPPVGAGGVQSAFKTKAGGGSFDLGSLLIVLGLGFAITCFAIAVVPATYVKWRPAAIFVSERQVDLTVVGLALLVVAAFTFFWTKGP